LGRHIGGVQHVAITKGGQYALSVGADTKLRVWNLKTLIEEETSPIKTHRQIYAVAIAHDEQYAVLGSDLGELCILNLENASIEWNNSFDDLEIGAIALMPNGQLAVAGADGLVRILSMRATSPEYTVGNRTGELYAVVVTPDGKYLIFGGEDRAIRVWNMHNNTAEHIMTGHEGWVRALALSPNALRLVSAGGDRTLRLWNIEEGRERAKIKLDGDALCVAVSNGRPPLVIAGDSVGSVYCLEWVE
jgi:WD40 repeat protein